jgi:hypothetical protein
MLKVFNLGGDTVGLLEGTTLGVLRPSVDNDGKAKCLIPGRLGQGEVGMVNDPLDLEPDGCQIGDAGFIPSSGREGDVGFIPNSVSEGVHCQHADLCFVSEMVHPIDVHCQHANFPFVGEMVHSVHRQHADLCFVSEMVHPVHCQHANFPFVGEMVHPTHGLIRENGSRETQPLTVP